MGDKAERKSPRTASHKKYAESSESSGSSASDDKTQYNPVWHQLRAEKMEQIMSGPRLPAKRCREDKSVDVLTENSRSSPETINSLERFDNNPDTTEPNPLHLFTIATEVGNFSNEDASCSFNISNDNNDDEQAVSENNVSSSSAETVDILLEAESKKKDIDKEYHNSVMQHYYDIDKFDKVISDLTLHKNRILRLKQLTISAQNLRKRDAELEKQKIDRDVKSKLKKHKSSKNRKQD